MNAATTALEIGALVRVTCNSGCFCTESDNCGLSGRIGTLTDINEHNTDGDFFGVSFPGLSWLAYFWAHELHTMTLAELVAEFEAVPAYVERYRSGVEVGDG